MPWDTDLYDEQKEAASYMGTHACLRAGPGTGKTLTLCRRIVYLVSKQKVSPRSILALTFTRSAANELRQRIREELKPPYPRISTLHSFALRQLLRNSDVITTVPTPLRIADDWEERHIILEDIKNALGVTLKDVRGKFNLLSADWETLNADREEWENDHPDPDFIGIWRQHSHIYGYTLRGQLVYELKRGLQNNPDFKLERGFSHLLVDEYQDLNKCDLAVVNVLTTRGAELFAAGDDDQSIYGFRFADPEGIRKFLETYPTGRLLDLQECRRCDRRILEIGQFVANLDYARVKKQIRPKAGAGDGSVNLLCFDTETQEAQGIALICKHMIETGRHEADKILLLIRSDFRNCFSEVLMHHLEGNGVPVACRAEYAAPLDTDTGREFLSLLRLSMNTSDHLAWRSLLGVRNNHIGVQTIEDIYRFAVAEGRTFSESLAVIRLHSDRLKRYGERVVGELNTIDAAITKFRVYLENQDDELIVRIEKCANETIDDKAARLEIVGYFREALDGTDVNSLAELLSAISVSMEDKEQVIESERVNILTMHQAKGLTSDVVFIVAAEDEYIPGEQVGREEDDARRLLYVSLTRAKHELFVTYCRRRTGRQRYTGRTGPNMRRTLTRFLRDSPLQPLPGDEYVQSL